MPRYTEPQARAAVAASLSYAEALRRLGMSPAGGNHKLFRRWVDQVWKIDTSHFDPRAASAQAKRRDLVPLEQLMTEGSTYPRARLKRRLLSEGLKRLECELCGQGELWRGRRMALILDHINGVPDDHRLENLRIVCPNCAATLPTHCGRKNSIPEGMRSCGHCGAQFAPRDSSHRYCGSRCAVHAPKPRLIGRPNPAIRKVDRPPYERLLAEIEAMNFSAVGRKYGVSGNAVRKWLRFYEREQERQAREGEGRVDDGEAA